MNKIRIYTIDGKLGTLCGILEQSLNEQVSFLTLQEQGDGTFWFTEDNDLHPTINLETWFPTLEEAEKYLENFHQLKIKLIEEAEVDLKWN